MLSPGMPWQPALSWVAVLSTSSAPLGHPHSVPVLEVNKPRRQEGKDISGFPTWA